MLLSELLGIKKGVTAIIGSGGKTGLIHKLIFDLSAFNKCIFTTSTHIFPSDTMPCLNNPSEIDVINALKTSNALCIGKLEEKSGKFVESDINISKLAKIADYVFVEADGSKGLPLKAHLFSEPVIPNIDICDIIMCVSVKAVGQKAINCVHRVDVFNKLTGTNPNSVVNIYNISELLNKENLFTKLFINQAETDFELENGFNLAKNTDKPCVIGSLKKGKYYACNN